MSDFKSEDRNMLVETHTLLKAHVVEMQAITKDHEARLRTIETRQTRLLTVFTLASAGIGSVIASTFHKFFS
jgi:hypothetical protein